jgi:hypothetical protein
MLSFAAAEVLLHLYTNAFAGYGYFRDELYYVACSRHLAFGYVDQPPLSSFILFVSLKLFGDSVFALRLLPAIVSGITVFLGGLITRRLGGGPSAIVLACLSIAIAPEFLGTNAIFSMNGFDWLFWSLAAYIVTLIIGDDGVSRKKAGGKLWILLGIVLGIGLLNKIDVLWLGASLFVGLLLTPQRKHLATKWPYIAGVLAFVLSSPYIIWNFTHNFATLEFIHRASSIKYSSQNPVIFITDTIRSLNSWSLPVWLAGVWYLIFNKEGKKFRVIGFIFVVTFFILIINWHSKAEYIAPAFPIVFAAGGVMFERIASHKWFVWTKYAMPALVAIYGLVSMPFAIPVLPVDSFIKYSSALGVKPSSPETQHLSDLPQWYADMFGWENMAATVSKVYVSLSPEEQKKTVVFAQNYGEAGAIDFFRGKYPLPRAICGHNNYWYWGPGDTTFTTVIVIGGRREDALNACDSVEQAGMIVSPHAMPYETDLPIYICRQFKVPFSAIWARARRFI